MAKPTLYAIVTHTVKPKARESTQIKLQNGKRLHEDDKVYTPEKVVKVSERYKGEDARNWVRQAALHDAEDLRLTDTQTIAEVQEVWDRRLDYNKFVVRQVHRRNGQWQCSTFYRVVELGPVPAAEWLELVELRDLKGLVDG